MRGRQRYIVLRLDGRAERVLIGAFLSVAAYAGFDVDETLHQVFHSDTSFQCIVFVPI